MHEMRNIGEPNIYAEADDTHNEIFFFGQTSRACLDLSIFHVFIVIIEWELTESFAVNLKRPVAMCVSLNLHSVLTVKRFLLWNRFQLICVYRLLLVHSFRMSPTHTLCNVARRISNAFCRYTTQRMRMRYFFHFRNNTIVNSLNLSSLLNETAISVLFVEKIFAQLKMHAIFNRHQIEFEMPSHARIHGR